MIKKAFSVTFLVISIFSLLFVTLILMLNFVSLVTPQPNPYYNPYPNEYAPHIHRVVNTKKPVRIIARALSTVDFTKAVDHSAVMNETTGHFQLTIKNIDNMSSNLQIMLYNPLTGQSGFEHSIDLCEHISVKVKIGGLIYTIYRIVDGEQQYFSTQGIKIRPNQTINVTVFITLHKTVPGDIRDNLHYDCYLYLFQLEAGYVDIVKFIVDT